MRFLIAVWLLLSLLSPALTTTESTDPRRSDARRQVIERAREKADRGDARLAGEIIKAGIRRFGGDERLYFYLGLYQYKSGQTRAAVENLERAIRQLDMDATTHYILAKALWKAGRYYEALAELGRVRRKKTDCYGARLDTAHLLREMGQYEAARFFYALSLAEKPADRSAREGLLAMDDVLGISPVMQNTYARLLKVQPGDDEVKTRKIRLLIYGNRFEEAMEVVRGLAADHPQRNHFRLAIMRGLKRWDHLERLAGEILQKDADDPAALAARIDAAIGEKRFKEAVDCGRDFLRRHPENLQAMMLTAFAQTHTGQFLAARGLYQRALVFAGEESRADIRRNLQFLEAIIAETGGDLK